ncbi:MAG: envelope stress response membrane protein PspB [Gammaproteobacteria bacterium]|nr:envelope stress response membrane protein PspB [Gammaproteobacteria bacterium]NVK89405.1 envelope stress response membrane protein PspB [Gammaproteobacteria bacterium]
MSEGILFVLGIIFMVVVVPYWLKLHYRGSSKKPLDSSSSKSGQTTSDPEQLAGLNDLADQLAQRVKNLEAILDDKAPGWRSSYER